MNEPPPPGSPDARRIVAAYAREECTTNWEGKPSTFCYGKRSRPQFGGDIATIFVWDGVVEDV